MPKFKITITEEFLSAADCQSYWSSFATSLSDKAKVVIEPYDDAVMIFTDGGCEKAGGLGSWAFVIVDENDNIVAQSYGVEDDTTNNRMEMLAVIKALETVEIGRSIVLTSDSKYVIQGITTWIKKWKRNGWKRFDGGEVLNKELWERMDALAQIHAISFEHVRGHNGHKWNELCDQMCTAAMQAHGKTVAPTG